MATDIAFVVGCMLILGSRVPPGLRVMVLSLAIADDIGAVLVIALGYSEGLQFGWLASGLAGILLVAILARLGVRSFGVYTIMGIIVWFAFHESGVHATIAGVILGLMTPAREYLHTGRVAHLLKRARQVLSGSPKSAHDRADHVRRLQQLIRETISPLEYLERLLHPWVSFLVMPLFALANAGVAIEFSALTSKLGLAVAIGLVVGKPLGIMLASWLALKAGIARMPAGVTWPLLLAGSCLAGIGFTMALFIAGLALERELLDVAKIGVLAGSALSAVLGMGLLALQPARRPDAKR
jgi:NhaA family Na+:H+ antiporter